MPRQWNRKRLRGSYRPSLGDDILSLLVDHKAPYRIFYRMLEGRYGSAGVPMPSPAVLRSTMSRLKQKGLLARKDDLWTTAKKGMAWIKRPGRIARIPHKPATAKNMMVLYDVPESERKKRDWLRTELTLLGFTMLQQSNWLGPGPLSREFVEAAHTMGVLPYLRFFSVKEEDIV